MPAPLTAAAVVNRAIQLVGGFDNNGPVTGTAPLFGGSAAGVAAGTVYDECVQTVARQYGWEYSRQVIPALTETGNSPPLGWDFEYIYETNWIQVRQVLPPESGIVASDPRPYRWNIGNALGGSIAASGNIAFSGLPTAGDTITLNSRVFTFVDSGATPSNYQINLFLDIGATLTIFIVDLQTSSTYLGDAKLNVATYSETGGSTSDTFVINYKTPGAAGNSYTLAKSCSVATLSGATLTGGITSQQKVIWTNIENAQAVVTNQPPEVTWDAMFAESVVQLIASKLNMALASKPESSKLAAEQGAAFEQAGERRTDT